MDIKRRGPGISCHLMARNTGEDQANLGTRDYPYPFTGRLAALPGPPTTLIRVFRTASARNLASPPVNRYGGGRSFPPPPVTLPR
jgi:hypothetical protein